MYKKTEAEFFGGPADGKVLEVHIVGDKIPEVIEFSGSYWASGGSKFITSVTFISTYTYELRGNDGGVYQYSISYSSQ